MKVSKTEKSINLLKNVISNLNNLTITHANDKELVKNCNQVTDILEKEYNELIKNQNHESK